MTQDEADLVSARAAQPDDLDLIQVLAEQGRDEARDQRGGRWLLANDMAPRITADAHRRAIVDPTSCLVAGEIDQTVVGYALAEASQTVEGSVCMVYELFVHPDARGIGVGSAILDAARSWALTQHCVAIESQVLPGNRAAKNFFERLGMVTRKMRVSTDL